MTNFALEKMLQAEGIASDAGRRSVIVTFSRKCSAAAALLGGEPSGHIIFSDFRLSGDGLLTTLKVAEAMVEAVRPWMI